MNTRSQDQLIYDKARTKVNKRNTMALLFMSIYHLTIFIVYQFNYLTSFHTNFKTIYLACAVSQICLFGVIFLLLSYGKKIFRMFYWLAYLYSIVLLYVPIYYLQNDYFHWQAYLAWIGSSLLFILFEKKFGNSLKTNKWCKIYYDYEIVIDENTDESEIQDIFLSESSFQEENEDIQEEKEPLTLPELSMRLGISIYASLMIFPIFLTIFSEWFASIDLKTVFATKDLFIFCIFSALIWTLPVFFFYYNHPASKKLTILCLAFETIRILIYSKTFIGYIQSNMYPIRVFILFILIDMIRYCILIHSLSPIFKMEMPESFEQDDENEYK